MSLYNEVNPLAVQHTKLAIKPNRSKWDTLLLNVLPKSVPHSKAAAKLQGLLRGARERRRAVSLLGGTASSTRKLGRLPGEWQQQLGERRAWIPKLLPDQRPLMGRW